MLADNCNSTFLKMCDNGSTSFELLEELLECIAKKLTRHIDILHFGQVCRSWRHVAVGNHNCLPLSIPICHCLSRDPLPLLMLPGEEGSNSCGFFSLSDQKIISSLSLPEIDRKWICGSSKGWLVLVDLFDPEEVLLFNPITRAQISLPPLSTFTILQAPNDPETPRECTFLQKVILSSEPNVKSSDCIVMAVVSNHQKLSFCRIGDDKWTNVEDTQTFIDDIIYHKGQVYSVNQRGFVVACNVCPVNGTKSEVRRVAGPASWQDVVMRKYLVESSGELLQVIRYNNDWEDGIYKTISFRLFKLDESSLEWIELKSLDDQMLFLGNNCSMSISAHDYPYRPRNCIHFTDDVYMVDFFLDAARDSGTFYLEDSRIEYYDSGSQIFTRPPIWVVPKPWWII